MKCNACTVSTGRRCGLPQLGRRSGRDRTQSIRPSTSGRRSGCRQLYTHTVRCGNPSAPCRFAAPCAAGMEARRRKRARDDGTRRPSGAPSGAAHVKKRRDKYEARSGSSGSERDDSHGHFKGRPGSSITDRCACRQLHSSTGCGFCTSPTFHRSEHRPHSRRVGHGHVREGFAVP